MTQLTMPATINAKEFSVGITATDLEKSIRFYTDGLGLEITDKGERDGKLQYVTMKAGAANISIGRDDFAKGKDRVKGVGMRMWLVIEQDLNAVCARVKAAGFPADEPAALPWGPIAFQVKDPDGIALTISNA
jgi:catechol 2,3-dioxygenase-like lactoylglutathione lyase family enzyme